MLTHITSSFAGLVLSFDAATRAGDANLLFPVVNCIMSHDALIHFTSNEWPENYNQTLLIAGRAQPWRMLKV